MTLRAWCFTGLLVVAGQAVVGAQPVPAVEGMPTGGSGALIRVRDDRLTVKLQDVSLESVLEEVGRRAAIEISIPHGLTQTVSMEFRDLSFEEGLRRLLRGYGWVMWYTASTPSAAATLAKVVVVAGGEGPPAGERGGGPDAKREGTLARQVAALLDREDVKTHLGAYLYGSTPTDRWNALQALLGAVDHEGLHVLVEMLQDDNVRSADWEAALAPLSGVIPLSEQRFMLRALRDPTVRESMVKTLESHAIAKARGGGQAP